MSQIKSKERVKNQGEVFTNKREVNTMLDLGIFFALSIAMIIDAYKSTSGNINAQ